MAHHVHALQRGQWIEIFEPSGEDLELLRRRFPQFHPTHLEDAMQRVVHPKMDLDKAYLFLSDIVPVGFEYGQKVTTFEVAVFLTSDAIVTVTPQAADLLAQERAADGSVAGTALPDTPQLLAYRFFERLYGVSGEVVDAIGGAVQLIDDNILTTTSPNIIREIAILQRNIIYAITALESSIPLFEELEEKDVSFGGPAMKEYWGDIIDKLEVQRDALEDYDKLLMTLASAHEMVVNRRTNRIITVLTVFSAIFLPLNLIAGIYGMNFYFLPFAESPYGFAMAVGSMVALAAALAWFFKSRRWI